MTMQKDNADKFTPYMTTPEDTAYKFTEDTPISLAIKGLNEEKRILATSLAQRDATECCVDIRSRLREIDICIKNLLEQQKARQQKTSNHPTK